MTRAISRLAVVAGIALSVIVPAPGEAATDSARYRRCMSDSNYNPAVALADAESWTRTGGGVPAEHCAGSALFSLKRIGSRPDPPNWRRSFALRCSTRPAMPG